MTRLRNLTLALMLASAPLGAIAPVAATAQTAAAIDVKLPYEEFRLSNGLRVVVHEDRKAPVIAVQVMYGVGSRDEPAGKTGFAHLFEHLMFNGSENYDKDFFVGLKDMGATQYNGTTNTDRTNYYETVPTGALEQILFLESDRMGHLLGAVTQEKLDNQIGVVQNEKRLGEDRPFGRRIFAQIFENLYPVGHPYHHQTIGSMEDLSNATLEDVKNWFRQYYGAANAVLVLAGDVNAAEARPLVEKYFGDIASGPPLQKSKVDSVRLTTNKSGIYYDRVDLPRVYRAYIAAPTGTADSPLLDIMANALGGGKTSRLHRRLVDEMQIANSVSVSYGEAILSGQIFFVVDAKGEQHLPAINQVLDEEIAKFLKTGPTASELSRTKTIYLASEIRGLEAVSGKAATLARGAVLVGDPNFYVEEQLDRMQAATVESVKAASARWLNAGYYQLDVLPFPNYSASKAGVDRKAGLPTLGTPGDSVFPMIEEGKLTNGMRVVVAPRPTIPVIEIGVLFDAGTATGNVGLGGKPALPVLAAMTTSLMDEGTTTLNAQAIASRQEELGADISIFNTQDDSKAYLSSLKANLRPSLALFADVVQNPAFPTDEIEKFRKQRIDALKQSRADVQALGTRALTEALYGADHPYGGYRTVAEAIAATEKASREDLLAWRQAWLRPDNATVFVSGDTTLAEVLPELERAFGRWKMAGTGAEKSFTTRTNPTAPRVIIIDKKDTQQSLILAGRLIGGSDPAIDTKLAAFNDSFGGNFLSRINTNLRETKGWSYGVRSFASASVGQGTFGISAPVQADRTGDSIAELLSEMRAITGGRPTTAAELTQTVAGIVGAQPGRFETAEAVIFSMMGNAVFGRPLDYDAGTASRYRALTLDDMAAMARNVIRPDELTWVIVGDWSKIGPQVTALKLGTIEVRSIDE